MNWIELVMIAVVGVVALWAFRRTSALEQEVNFVRRRSTDLIDDLAEEIEKLHQEVRRLRTARSSGRFTAEMRVDELSYLHPDAPAVLAAFHIGGCQSCSVDDGKTLGDAIRETGANGDQVLGALNGLLADNARVRAELAKVGQSGLLQIQTSR